MDKQEIIYAIDALTRVLNNTQVTGEVKKLANEKILELISQI